MVKKFVTFIYCQKNPFNNKSNINCDWVTPMNTVRLIQCVLGGARHMPWPDWFTTWVTLWLSQTSYELSFDTDTDVNGKKLIVTI